MSRTFRRDKQHMIHNWIGSFTEYLAYELTWAYRMSHRDLAGFFEEDRQKALLAEYLKKVTDYTRDQHCGKYGVPHWFRNENTREERREQRREIHRCRVNDEWDDFLLIKNPDQRKWYLW